MIKTTDVAVISLVLNVVLFLSVLRLNTPDIDKIKAETAMLLSQQDNLTLSVTTLTREREALNAKLADTRSRIVYTEAEVMGAKLIYIVRFKLAQSHFTLDIGQHLKDSMNAVEFDMPVDREYYDNVTVGAKVVDNFRVGSMLIDGSFGSWDMKIVGKRVETKNQERQNEK
jgi:hypothetical protein